MPSGGRRIIFGDKCKDCKEVLTEVNGKMKGTYLQPYCNICWKKRDDARPSRTTEGRRLQYVAWKFGLTPEEYQQMVKLQFGLCAICQEPCNVRASLAVDHDHKTGQVRDLLCHRCNMVLGGVNDNTELLSKMISYLERHAIRTA